MYYSPESIKAVADRIGWPPPIEPSNIVLSYDNLLANSGRKFNAFHALVTVMNIKAVLPDANTSNDTMNDTLFSFKKQGVLQILNAIFNNNIRAHYTYNKRGRKVARLSTDYTDMILNNLSVFDEAYGLQVALDILQLHLTSNRSNATERNVKEVQTIRLDLEGVYDDAGKEISPGIKGRLAKAIAEAIDILFPERPQNEKVIFNASNRW